MNAVQAFVKVSQNDCWRCSQLFHFLNLKLHQNTFLRWLLLPGSLKPRLITEVENGKVKKIREEREKNARDGARGNGREREGGINVCSVLIIPGYASDACCAHAHVGDCISGVADVITSQYNDEFLSVALTARFLP